MSELILDTSKFPPGATAFAIGRRRDDKGKEKVAIVFAAGGLQVVVLLDPEHADACAEQIIAESASIRTGLTLPTGAVVGGS
jgi:hypothetical protein